MIDDTEEYSKLNTLKHWQGNSQFTEGYKHGMRVNLKNINYYFAQPILNPQDYSKAYREGYQQGIKEQKMRNLLGA